MSCDDDEENLNDPGTRLRAAMETIEVDPDLVSKLHELFYTADERGILGFAVNDDYTIKALVRIIRLAETASPEDLKTMRM